MFEGFVAADGQILFPRDVADVNVVDIGVLDQDEHVEGQTERQDHHEVQDCSPSQDDTKGAPLVLEQLVLERGKTSEVGAVLDLVQAFGATMNRSLCQADQEGHQDERKNAKQEHGNHRQEVPEKRRLILNDRVGNGVAVRTLYLSRPKTLHLLTKHASFIK